ncbi:tyrosine-type recombinase/integrase [Oceanimonas doudoroffii]|uniref:Tyr recombinase domain-containing protein n=1 Tax=Oceanimonas doudoroffii TaxID=84158 RepID=A0A233RDA0_9GAMM|nr:site-specific integrase [Oceanimonas doudoroffii]OXY81366.1 hypothetical protein B6S08_12825 [Oceanimonas doudoroffii]
MTVDILVNVPIRLGVAETLGPYDERLVMKGNYRSFHVPILIGDFSPKLRRLINLYVIRKASDGRKDLTPTVKAFKVWVRWLIDYNINPFSSYEFKYDSPTYGFRQYLIERVSSETLSSSTANAYILVIKDFYDMLDYEGIVNSENYYKSKLSIVDGYRKVQSSDLAIRVVKAGGKSLKPLNEKTQAKLLSLMENQSEEFKLILKLMLTCGLRLSEVITLPESIFREELFQGESVIRGLKIGPSVNVETKFSKEREIFFTSNLLEQVLDYKNSKRYSLRKLKRESRNPLGAKSSRLFISKTGRDFSKQAFYSAWFRLKKEYERKYCDIFPHKPHDLRATFANNLIKFAMNIEPGNQEVCISVTKYFMGHVDEKTTLKYVSFFHQEGFANCIAQVMDEFFSTALKDEL